MDDLLTVAKAAVAAVMGAKTFRTDSDTLAAIEALEDACEREEAARAAAKEKKP